MIMKAQLKLTQINSKLNLRYSKESINSIINQYFLTCSHIRKKLGFIKKPWQK